MKLLDLFRRKKPEPVKIDNRPGGVTVVGSMDELMKALRQFNDDAPQMISDTQAMLEHSSGIKPPSDPLAEGWLWRKWHHEQTINSLPGWPFCRFANRLGRDRAEFVFGNVKGSFGIWQKPYSVCIDDEKSTTLNLTALTHLASGHGIGVFDSREIAAEAAELADKVADWKDVDPERPDTWHEVYDRTSNAWGGIGIRSLKGRHCHDNGSPPMYIMGRTADSIMEGRPEKLS